MIYVYKNKYVSYNLHNFLLIFLITLRQFIFNVTVDRLNTILPIRPTYTLYSLSNTYIK